MNLGFKLPAGGGTDATTNYAAPIRGQVGFDRVYVWTPEWPASIGTWMDGLKQGRTFATNGPLVEFKLGGEMVGSELKFDAPQAAVPFTAKLRSIVPVDHLEVVCNGKVAQDSGARRAARFGGCGRHRFRLNESGWCVLRAWSDKAEYPVMDNYAYATTSPVYVTIGGQTRLFQRRCGVFQGVDRPDHRNHGAISRLEFCRGKAEGDEETAGRAGCLRQHEVEDSCRGKSCLSPAGD